MDHALFDASPLVQHKRVHPSRAPTGPLRGVFCAGENFFQGRVVD
ncbi:hypothetical protein [Streptomyces sp. NBRC 110028]|nr:hypothetical protein [Streptomyces sp. NBRC 110028]